MKRWEIQSRHGRVYYMADATHSANRSRYAQRETHYKKKKIAVEILRNTSYYKYYYY